MVREPRVLVERVTNELLQGITDKVKALPHRDVTIGSYKDWVGWYIHSLRRFSALIHEEGKEVEGEGEASGEGGARGGKGTKIMMEKKREGTFTRDFVKQTREPFSPHFHHAFTPWGQEGLAHFRRELDATLLSSIFASKWNEVYLPLPFVPKVETRCNHLEEGGDNRGGEGSMRPPSSSSTSSSSSPNTLPAIGWWGHSNVHTWKNISHSTIEVFSPEFLTEPLLGGRTLSVYWNGLKSLRRYQASSPSRPPRDVQQDGPREGFGAGGGPTMTITPPPCSVFLIPFSTLWVLKAEAFGHAIQSCQHYPSTSQTFPRTWNASSPSANAKLSFQERQVRQGVLNTLQYSWELISAPSPPFRWDSCAAFPRLALLSPCEEFDAICSLPVLRRRFLPPFSSSSSSSVAAPPSHWTIDGVAEDATWRLSYLARACAELVPRNERSKITTCTTSSSFSSTAATTNGEGEAENKKTSFQSPFPSSSSPSSSEKLGEESGRKVILLAPAHRHACYRKLGTFLLKDRTTALENVVLPDGNVVGGIQQTTRKEVVQGCKEAAKKLANREENIRQVFHLK